MDGVGQHAAGPRGASSIEAPLLELAAQEATGVLVVTNEAAEEAFVWLRDGSVYAVSVPGRRPLLGVRLVSSGVITPEALAEALEVQRTELQGWRLGELLVHLGFVQRPVIDEYVTEQMNDQFADLLGWDVRQTVFRNGEHTRSDMTLPHEVSALLSEARERLVRWAAVLDRVGGPDNVPDLESTSVTQSELGPHEWAMLCKVDGIRSVLELADECGFTLYEAARLVADLQEAGLVSVPGRSVPDDQPLAKVLQLHPGAPVAHPTTSTTQPHRPTVPTPPAPPLATASPAATVEPADNWAQISAAATLLSELAHEPHDLLDVETFGEAPAEPLATEFHEPTFHEVEPEQARAPEPVEPLVEEAPALSPDVHDAEEDEPEPDEDDPAEPESPGGEGVSEFTDTASLLRELSSLGSTEDGPGARLTSHRPKTGGDGGKRRRGFLGR